MFVPQDPRFEEILRLAGRAAGSGLLDRDRPRWRELCAQLLGEMKAQGPVAHQRRKNLRAPSTFQVHLLAPSDVSGLVASSIGSGGMCVQLDRRLPVGADVELSIAVDRKEPLRARAQVVYVLDTFETGMTFIDLVQGDRERLEAIAVRTLLARSAAQ